MEHGAVADLEWLGGRGAPVRPRLAAFKERESVRIKQRPPVGWQTHGLVLHAAIDGAECCQQATPRIKAGIQDFLDVLVRDLLKLIVQGGDGIEILVILAVGWKENFPLLGAHQKYQPHHDRQGGFIKLLFTHASQQLAVVVLVNLIKRLDQDFDGLTHLPAQLFGDLLLIFGALSQQRLDGLVIGYAKKAFHREQGLECLKGQRFFNPKRRKPGREPARLAAWRVDQHPVLAVGDQAQRDVSRMQQLGHAGGR